MAFALQIMPSALAELQSIKVFYRKQIVKAIDEQLTHQPVVPTRNRKPMPDVEPSFACDPPLWELRVGHFRDFYDADEVNQIVYVRAVRDKPPHAATEEVI